MKKFNLITFAVILMLLPILQSCLDDANNDEWVTCPPGGILAIGTIVANAGPLDTDTIQTISVVRQASEVYDTIDTADKFVKIILYTDQTWEEIELDRPHFDEDEFDDNWDNEKIHAYKGILPCFFLGFVSTLVSAIPK